MNTENLQSISGSVGVELRSALDEVGKDANVVGGGLRHGEVEWQVHYHWSGLERFLFFSVDAPSEHVLTFTVRAATTDARGRWAYLPVASTTLPEEIVKDQLGVVVRGMLEHGRMLVNALESRDLAPMVHEYFSSAD